MIVLALCLLYISNYDGLESPECFLAVYSSEEKLREGIDFYIKEEPNEALFVLETTIDEHEPFSMGWCYIPKTANRQALVAKCSTMHNIGYMTGIRPHNRRIICRTKKLQKKKQTSPQGLSRLDQQCRLSESRMGSVPCN